MNARLAAVAAIAVAAVVIIVIAVGGGSSGYRIKVNLADAEGLRSGSRVEIGGVQVGSVRSLRITPQDTALATISLKSADAPIGSGASVVIRPANLLGEMYIDLSAGDRRHPEPAGYTIPVSHTSEGVSLDQVLDVLEPTTRDALAIMIHELGVALFGRGTDLAAVLQALPPSVADTRALIDQVTASNQTLQALLDHAGRVVATVAASRGSLGRLVTTAADALTATAQHQSQLAATVADAPATLAQLRTTLEGLDRAGAALRPAALGLRRTAPSLTATLNALPGFTAAALPTLAKVRSVAPSLTRLGEQASPVIAELRPTATSLSTLATDADPLTSALDSSASDLLGTLQNWARAIQTRDGLSHEFRVSVEVTPSLITALTPLITGARSSSHPASQPKPAKGNLVSKVVSGVTQALKPAGKPAPAQTAPPSLSLPGLPTITLPPAAQGAAPVTSAVQSLLNYLFGK
ncbi:MAG TPA: MlaD family protein [Solirubrobacteraceae bacterium]|jgi:phospholipid/cholesterol/gamma-HCH transport system substrate-binding protein|nr:MlaD family protein [Solirubrobacteraceae bacterium]